MGIRHNKKIFLIKNQNQNTRDQINFFKSCWTKNFKQIFINLNYFNLYKYKTKQRIAHKKGKLFKSNPLIFGLKESL